MKKLLIFILITVIPFIGFAQEKDSTTKEAEVFTIVEKMPEFPRGKAYLNIFIATNIQYPPEAKAKNIQGKVYVNFIVGKDGVIKDAKVKRGVHKLLDEEALRLVNNMPNWEPGEQGGKKVTVSFNLPITFSLEKSNLPSVSTAIESYKLGTKFYDEGKFNEAISHYSNAIFNDPKYLDAYYNRGFCYFKINELDKACADWTMAKEMGDKDAEDLVKNYCNKE